MTPLLLLLLRVSAPEEGSGGFFFFFEVSASEGDTRGCTPGVENRTHYAGAPRASGAFC